MYLVIFFYEENSVEGVPKNWVRKCSDGKSYCYWPSQFNKNKISKLVKDLAPLSKTWKVYPCTIKAEAIDYQSMLVKAKEAEIATTEAPTSSNDEDDTPVKRRRTKQLSDSDESPQKLQTPPFKQKKTQMSGKKKILFIFYYLIMTNK